MYSTVWIIAIILAGVVFLVFSGTIEHQFVNYDDDIYVYENPRVQALSLENTTWFLTNFYYYAYIPVTMLSHSIDYAFWRADARGHHLTNVLLHGLNAAWVFIVGLAFLRIAGKEGGVLDDHRPDGGPGVSVWAMTALALAALLFSVHPLRAESVAWVSD